MGVRFYAKPHLEILTLTEVKLADTDATHYLKLKYNEDASADYYLYWKVNGANRTIDLAGDLTLTGANQVANWDFYDGTDTHTIKAVQETGLGGRLTFGLDETARTMVICDIDDIDTDFGLAASSDPQLLIYDNSGTNKTVITQDRILIQYPTYGLFPNNSYFKVTGYQGVELNATTDRAAGHMFLIHSSANIEITDADAEQAWMYLEPKINQTSTAGYIGLLMDVTESSTGSGTNALMDLRVATASKFMVANDGEVNTVSSYGTMQTATGSVNSTTIDWGLGNFFYFTLGAGNETFVFTAPANKGRITLVLKQDGSGSRTATWPGTVLWPGDVAPTLTTTAAYVDIVSFFYDGSNYFGLFNGDFR